MSIVDFFTRRRSSRIAARRRADSVVSWESVPLEQRLLLAGDVGAELGLAIDLRGQSGQEFVELWAGDNFISREFLTTDWRRFEFDIEDPGLTPTDIQVRFVNDLFFPGGLDRNVEVGTLFLNGDEFDPNSADTFSTGTWTPEDGVVAGSGRGSVLNANGVLQFGTPQGSVVTVYARGDEGSEDFLLKAGSEDYRVTGVSTELQAYSFFLDETVTPDAVRIQFLNDRFIPGLDFDHNLTVDRIEIDGQVFQTESPDVFQTGVFRDGFVQEGFLQSETLQANGFFQFGATELNGPRYTQSTNVSGGDGLIEFDRGNFAIATSLSDGSFAGTTESFFATGVDDKIIQVFDASGNVDGSFNGGEGVNIASLIQSRVDQPLAALQIQDVLVDSQDRISVTLNSAISPPGESPILDTWAVRLMRNGDVDASFGDAGVTRFPTEVGSGLRRYAMDPLDRLIVANASHLARLTNVGQLDASFGNGGVQSYQPILDGSELSEIQAREDRSIVMVTVQRNRIPTSEVAGTVRQFNEDGSAGTWFADDGVFIIPRQKFSSDSSFGEIYRSFAIDDEGRIVLSGRKSVIRLTDNGRLDETFGIHGVARLPSDVISDGQFFRFGIESGPVLDSAGRVVLAANEGFI